MDDTFAVRSAGASAPVRMRTVCAADIPFVDALVARLFPTAVPGDYTLEELLAGTRGVLRRAIASPVPEALFEIAHDRAGQPVGFIYVVTVASFFTQEPYAHISEIVSARDRAGVGRIMMARAQDWARERGYGRISLNVMHANEGAIAFYERLGYRLELHRYFKKITDS